MSMQQLNYRISLLEEIAQIMDSLKVIAMIESQQVRGRLDAQREGLSRMKLACSSFMQSFSMPNAFINQSCQLLMVFGSERGFCGDFNAQLVREIDSLRSDGQLDDVQILPIGYRLANKLKQDSTIMPFVTGPGVSEEIESTLSQLLERITQNSQTLNFASVSVMYYDEHAVVMRPLLAELFSDQSQCAAANPPQLNLSPEEFFVEFVSQFVFAILNQIATQSFVAENLKRMQHLENALQQIEQQRNELSLKKSRLRQEEITEELEIILLSDTANHY